MPGISFIKTYGVLCLAICFGIATCPLGLAARADVSAVLSNDGSGRATAYWEQNKIITVGEKTHVVWLDAGKEGFRVRGRTLDRVTGHWSPIVTIGEAQDNHGGPGLTVDSKGFLHVVYYPHHGAFRHRRSLRSNDLSEWGPEIRFGEELSFPSIICGPDDTLILTARRGHHDAEGKHIDGTRMEQELWKKPEGGDWRRKATLIRSRHPGYAQFATALAWGPDHKTIHLSCRIYEGHPFGAGYQRWTVGYMVSPDTGETWTHANGTPVVLPATGENIDVLAKAESPSGPRLSSGPVAVNAAGVPHLIYSASAQGSSRLYLATTAPGLGWTRRELTPHLPETARGWKVDLTMGGGITFSGSGRATVVAVVLNPPPEDKNPLMEWGHPSTEILRLWSDDGLNTFQSEVIAPVDAKRAHWLPNIERATGHNRVPREPGIIYTAGGAGAGLRDLELNNQVIWRPRN